MRRMTACGALLVLGALVATPAPAADEHGATAQAAAEEPMQPDAEQPMQPAAEEPMQPDAEQPMHIEAEPAMQADDGGAPAESTAATGTVARALFTTGVADREPVDTVETLTNDHSQVSFFTDLQNLQGRSVVHRWEFNGDVLAEVPFDVRGPRWRVHSSKNLLPGWLGEWTVSVVDDSGTVLHSETFQYVPAEVAPPAAPEATSD